MALSAKHKRFIDEYLLCFNATAAYERVYSPKTRAAAASAGHRLLRNVEISEAIAQRLQAKTMGADEVLMRLADMGRADLGPYMNDDGEVDIGQLKEAGLTHLIHTVERSVKSGVSQNGNEWENVHTKVKTYSALDALQLLAKHHKLLTDKVHHDGDVDLNVNYVNNWRDKDADN